MENKSRTTMLAISAALFIATAGGWAWHNSQSQPARLAAGDEPKVAVANAPAIEIPPQKTEPTVSAVSTRGVYRSTSMEEAIAAAKASVKREPMQPLTHGSVTDRVSAPEHRAGRSSPSTVLIPPPPNVSLMEPPVARVASFYQEQPATSYPERRNNKLTTEDFRLVGLIDGKAIFKLRSSRADELLLPHSFTLGQGESFANIKLDRVTVETATVHDGNQLAVKSLEPVH